MGKRPGESPHTEELAILLVSKNLHVPRRMVRKANKAELADDKSELTRSEEVNPWMLAKLKESYHQVRQENDQRKSIVQQELVEKKDFLRRIIAPVNGQGGVTLSHVCPHCHRFPSEDYIRWVSQRHGGVRRAAGGTRTEF